MKVQEALDSIDKQYGLYNQVEILYAEEDGATFVPSEDSMYDVVDIDFLESKFNELMGIA